MNEMVSEKDINCRFCVHSTVSNRKEKRILFWKPTCCSLIKKRYLIK